MLSTVIPSASASSQLIQRLHELSVLDKKVPHSRFVATLGKFIDFSEAFSLSSFLTGLPSTKASHESGDYQGAVGAKKYYIQARGEMMLFIIQSFITENCPVSLRLPLKSDATFSLEDQGLSAYQRFYALHQSEMESHIAKLQAHIRRYMSASSSSLAQLAALDAKLGDILTRYSRQSLKIIPSLLAKRFHYLCDDSPNAVEGDTQAANNQLQVFLIEMQSVLLAELEIRLQPVLGMIEALALEDFKEEESTR